MQRIANKISKYIGVNIYLIDTPLITTAYYVKPSGEKYINICTYNKKPDQVISYMLHEAGHAIHLRKYSYNKQLKLMRSKHREKFIFICELQAWKNAIALSAVLDIPYYIAGSKHAINSYVDSFSSRKTKKLVAYAATI